MRAFLSHSSKDKDHYVRIVAKELGIDRIVLDELTFEDGMQPMEEILSGMQISDVFVAFLSEAALESKWVQTELDSAHSLHHNPEDKRFFPILIDSHLMYRDSRISDWIRADYNLQHITRPKIAARRIKQRLVEMSWKRHPKLQERNQLFVGRNIETNQLEERINDFSNTVPVSVIASGMGEIGRRSFLRHSFRKCKIIDRTSYDVIVQIPLRQE